MSNLLMPSIRCGIAACQRRYSTAQPTGSTLSWNDRPLDLRWLLDSCQCHRCIHPSTKQKLHKTTDVLVDAPRAIVSQEGSQLHVDWGGGHQSVYPTEFLNRYLSPSKLQQFHDDPAPVAWGVESLQRAKNLFLPYERIQSPSGLSEAIAQLTRYGLLFITGLPTSSTSNETCELRKLGERFGEIRSTFYGETWDVKNVRNSKNIAYTNVELGLHMDLLYFQHPPRYQILHCLKNRVIGGTSIFVDALQAASTLRRQHPEDFDILARTPVAFHYINDGHHLHHTHPTIELAPSYAHDPSVEPPVAFINYSPPFQAPLPPDTPPEFYMALSRFASLLERPEMTYNYLLRESDAVMFDNRRVLHARTAFEDKEEGAGEGDTNRWLKGCYLEADAVLDRGRVLRARARDSKM